MPLMRPTAVGYGAGQADPEHWPNALRILYRRLGPAIEGTDTIVQIETNVDDCTRRPMRPSWNELFAAGAVDVNA